MRQAGTDGCGLRFGARCHHIDQGHQGGRVTCVLFTFRFVCRRFQIAGARGKIAVVVTTCRTNITTMTNSLSGDSMIGLSTNTRIRTRVGLSCNCFVSRTNEHSVPDWADGKQPLRRLVSSRLSQHPLLTLCRVILVLDVWGSHEDYVRHWAADNTRTNRTVLEKIHSFDQIS